MNFWRCQRCSFECRGFENGKVLGSNPTSRYIYLVSDLFDVFLGGILDGFDIGIYFVVVYEFFFRVWRVQ